MTFGGLKLARLTGVACVLAAGLSLALLAAAGCGRMPPEPFWEPSAEDSAAIRAAVSAESLLLRFGFDETELVPLDTVLSDTNRKKLTRDIRDNPFKPRFRCNAMQRLFYRDSFRIETSFIATIDTLRDSVLQGSNWVESTWVETTATVTVVETIPGLLRLQAFKATRYLRDSLLFPSPGETLRLKYYDTLFTDTSLVVEKPLNAAAIGGCVLKKEGGQWKLWKLSGGSRLYAPNPDDAPYLAAVYMASGSRNDTVLLRPDTLKYGIQRFYTKPTQLLNFTTGDSIRVTGLLTSMTDAVNFLHFRGARLRMSASARFYLTEPGLDRLYVEQVPVNVLYDMDGRYTAVAWGIPINVTGGVK